MLVTFFSIKFEDFEKNMIMFCVCLFFSNNINLLSLKMQDVDYIWKCHNKKKTYKYFMNGNN